MAQLTDDVQRDNLRELWDLLEDVRGREYQKYGLTYHGGDYRDVIALHVNAGLLGTYDTALPQTWWDDFYTRTGEPPYGMVWAYGSLFGGPYPVTSDGARRLSMFRANGGRP